MFNFFSFKKNPVIEDVIAKVPEPTGKPLPVTVDEDLFAQFTVEPAVIEPAVIAPANPIPAPAVLEAAPFTAPDELAEVAPVPVPVPVAAEPLPVSVSDPVAAAAEPAPAPAASPDVEVPIDTIKMTQEDVVAAYKIFLRRKPENQMVVESRLGLSREKLLVNFITAKEFIKYPENINLILQTARQIELKMGQTAQEEVK
jgi:hypothetical protein